jgi:tetratricopeptide (TPR) repeat protein
VEKLAVEFPEDTGYRRLQANGHFNLGNLFAAADRHQEAVKAYRHGLKIDSANAALHDGLAWLLASNPDPLVHDAPEAVKLAQEAVSLAPRVADYWRTLGVAHCEAADWKAGAKALEEAVKLRKGGDSIDWFFLAMAQAKLGDRDKASEYYSRGVRWMEENRPQDRALRRYRAKVERLLDLPEKE